MKKLILASALAVMSASSFASIEDQSGFRIGGGFGTDVGKYQLNGLGDSGKVMLIRYSFWRLAMTLTKSLP